MLRLRYRRTQGTKGNVMTTITTRVVGTIDEHPRLIAGVLGAAVLFFLTACLLHDVIPICHWLFGCDHRMH